MLAVARRATAAASFDFSSATPALPIAIGRPASSHPRSLAAQAPNSPRPSTASAEIPIATDAQPHHVSRGFLLWRFAYAGPSCPPPPLPWGRHPQTFTGTEVRAYSITSSAATSSPGGTVRPSALAVLRLTTRRNRVGCSKGRSAGFSPFKTRRTRFAPRSAVSFSSGP